MTVRCPHCLTRYELPPALMGAAGATVRCPSCRGVFAVSVAGEVRALETPAAGATAATDSRAATAAPPAAPPATTASPPDAGVIARSLVVELAARAGDAPREAWTRGRLFSEWGPALGELFDEYRRRLGAGADGAALRAALRDRWGIDLPDNGGG